MGEASPSAEPRSPYPLCGEYPATPPTAVMPAKAGTSFFSSKGALVVLALLRSAGCCASELVTQVNLVTASLGLVILYAADGDRISF